MRIERLNPAGLHATPGYHHLTVVEPGRLVFLSGQCPLRADATLVGEGDLLAQVDQVIANTLVCLAEVGAGASDVVRTTIWVVSANQDELASVWRRLGASALGPAFESASTLVGVAQLASRASSSSWT
jgi:enamine deaminase RidA (YjgF/YER057c/UK114 family)